MRGSRAAGRPGRVTPASPTWRRGPGGLLRGREEKAAQACGALPSRAPTTATGTTELGPALCSAEGHGALFWGVAGVEVLWREFDFSFLSLMSAQSLSLIVKSQPNRVSQRGGADTLVGIQKRSRLASFRSWDPVPAPEASC